MTFFIYYLYIVAITSWRMQYPYPQLDDIIPTANEKIIQYNVYNTNVITLDQRSEIQKYRGDTMIELNWVLQDRESDIIIEFIQGAIYYRYRTKKNTINWQGLGIPIDLADKNPTYIRFSKRIYRGVVTMLKLEEDRKFILSHGCRYKTEKINWTVHCGYSFTTKSEDTCRIKYDDIYETTMTDYLYFVINQHLLSELIEAGIPEYAMKSPERVAVHSKDIQKFDWWYNNRFPEIPHYPWTPIISRGDVVSSRADMHMILEDKLKKFWAETKLYSTTPRKKSFLRAADVMKKEKHEKS